MKGYLIYDSQEALKNQGFIRMFQERGQQVGMDFTYIPLEDYRRASARQKPDVVLNRTRRSCVSRWYEKQQIPVFHCSRLVELANDKYQTLKYLENHLPVTVKSEKWCPKSQLMSAAELEKVFLGQKNLPESGVIKSLDGHGGREVFLTSQDFAALRGRDCLLQERILSESQDLRVYILGGRIYQAVLRRGEHDFRSNYSLGGSVRPYPLSVQQKEWILQFIQSFPPQWLGMLGMDFILDNRGQLIFNEIEEMVGCRMLYQCTSRDIVKDYVVWLKTFVENTNCNSHGM